MSCCIQGCGATRSKCRGLSFFKVRRQTLDWDHSLRMCISSACRGKLNWETASICSRHFDCSCLKTTDDERDFQNLMLKEGSLPSLFMPETWKQAVERKPPMKRSAPEIKKELITQYRDALKNKDLEDWKLMKKTNNDFHILLIKDFVIVKCVKVLNETTAFYVDGTQTPLIGSGPETKLLYANMVTSCKGITDTELVKVADLLGKNHYTNYKYDEDQDVTRLTVRHKQCAGVGKKMCSFCKHIQKILKERVKRREQQKSRSMKARTPLLTATHDQLVNAIKIERAENKKLRQQLRGLGFKLPGIKEESVGKENEHDVTVINDSEMKEENSEGNSDSQIDTALEVSMSEAPIASQSTVSLNHTSIKTQGNPKRKWKCHFCDKLFSQSSDLKVHIRSHTGERPYKCKFCNKSFSQNGSLTVHIRSHTGERPFKCKFCGFFFGQSRTLLLHMRRHTGDRRFKCKVCEKSFIQSHHLLQHTRTHVGEKVYNCTVCSIPFSKPRYLTALMRIHTGEKPSNRLGGNKCGICQKTFKCSYYLGTHMRIHTGEKPYKCSICKKAFNCSAYIKAHMRIHTGQRNLTSVHTVKNHSGNQIIFVCI